MESSSSPRAHPPETLEGWYALHQVFTVDRASPFVATTQRVDATQLSPSTPGSGWTGVAQLIGSRADIMVIHFRPTLDEIGQAQEALRATPLMASLEPVYSFLSVTEAGLYHLTAQ